MTKIAYQGERFSNCEFAAKQLAQLLDLGEVSFVPKRTSSRVVDTLLKREADYGVVAVHNSIFGEVAETAAALADVDAIEHGVCNLPIHHCLYSLSADIGGQELTHIYSHPQALGQCTTTLNRVAPNAQRNSTEDTAFAARQLKEGNFSPTSGVICRKEAGEHHGLNLIAANIEDEAGNTTTFKVFSIRASNAIPVISRKERLINLICRPSIVRWTISGLLTLMIFAALLLNAYLGWTAWTISSTLVGALAAAVITLTSPKYILWAQQRRIVGYWKYRPVPKREDAPVEEKHDVERIVIIDRINGELRLRGWQVGDGDAHRWQSDGTLFHNSSDAKGQLIYEYRNTLSHKQATLVGIVSLYWNTTDPAQLVTDMSGLYYGHGATQDDGTLTYKRISGEEFERLRFAKQPQ